MMLLMGAAAQGQALGEATPAEVLDHWTAPDEINVESPPSGKA